MLKASIQEILKSFTPDMTAVTHHRFGEIALRLKFHTKNIEFSVRTSMTSGGILVFIMVQI